MAAGRAAALLAVAVILGIVLLNALDDGPSRVTAGPADVTSDTTATSAPRDTPTSTTTTTTAPARLPKEVKVLAINGTAVKGAAGKAKDILVASGFNALAPVSGTMGSATAVYFAPTYEPDAAAVAAALGVATVGLQPLPTPPPVADIRGANVVVVVGADLAGRLVVPTATSTTATPRVAASTSTTRAATPSSTAASTTTTTKA